MPIFIIEPLLQPMLMYDRHDYGSGANINPIGPEPDQLYYHDPGDKVIVCMSWNNYPATDQDYDLILIRWTGSEWVFVTSSKRRQSGLLSPEEFISYENAHTNGMYGIVVEKHSATSNVDFTLFSLEKRLGYHTNASSLADPATLNEVISVGAIDRNN